MSVVSKKFTKQLATVGCFVPIVTTRKVMYQLFFPRALARIRPNRYLWNQPIWEPLKSTFEAKLWNKICSMVTMHGTFCQTGPPGSGLDRFFPVFGVKMIKNMKILLHFGFSQVTFDVPDLKKNHH